MSTDNKTTEALFGDFVKDPSQLLGTLEQPLKLQNRIVLAVAPRATHELMPRSTFEYVGRNVGRPWVLESVVPIPILSSLVDDVSPQTVSSAYATFGNHPELRVIAAMGMVEFGIQDFGGRRLFGSYGEVIAVVITAVFSLAPEFSWADDSVLSTWHLKEKGTAKVGSRVFYCVA
jgi:hypothetical protein